MITIFSSNYLARKPIEKAMKNFAKNFKENEKILDIGCGKKPYAKYFSCEYIGVDPLHEINPDIIADAWKIPVEDNSFDGIVLNQSLEHISETQETIDEIKRILKPGGLCLVTVPQTMKIHSIPIPSEKIKLNNFDKNKIRFFNIDYYRFTKFGLINLFKEFKIVDLKETNGYCGTICQLICYFLASLKPLDRLLFPIFFILNLWGILIDNFFRLLYLTRIGFWQKFYEIIYLSLTLNYILIIKK